MTNVNSGSKSMLIRWAYLSFLTLGTMLFIEGCSSKSPSESTPPPVPQAPPSDYPDIPKPASPLDLDVPMQSESLSVVMPIFNTSIDFVPQISNGTFVWDVDIQTQYIQRCIIGCPQGVTEIAASDAPGDYYNGTRQFSQMIFESGVVNLTNLQEFHETENANTGTQHVVFVQSGDIVEPRSPYRDDCWFDWWGNTANKHVTPALFAGYYLLPVEPAVFETGRWRRYYVAAKSCDSLTTPVFVRRDRFWTRVLIDGKKSIRVDPGNTFTVSYERTQGVSVAESEEFARTLDIELGLGGDASAITGSLGTTLTETFSREVEVSEETTVTTSREVTGLDGKTVIFSVWRSVERYTITDSLGNPYTDPNFTFSELGETEIHGEYEWLSSAIFDL